MKIFVDFDNTIFDSKHEFRDRISDIFYKYGISKELRQKTLEDFSSATYESGLCYSPGKHIKMLNKITNKNINKRVFLQEISKFLENLEKFVFEDFYAFVNMYDRKDLIILSYGEDEFQKQKIKGSGVSQFFEDIIITQGDKAIEIEEYMQNFPNEVAVLIDDKSGYFKSVKNLSINTKTIHVLMGDEACEDDNWCDVHVSNLRNVSGIMG